MTPTTTEREARELLAREYEAAGDAGMAADIRNDDPRYGLGVERAIRAIIAALTREQEVQGSVVCRLHPRYKAKLPPRSTAVGCICAEIYNHKHPAPPNTTKPAPVDVRVDESVRDSLALLERATYHDGRYRQMEHDDWQQEAQQLLPRLRALLDGQPAGVDESTWREGWAFAYSGTRLYGDDGELQDNSEQPFIDWRRDSATEIRAKIRERANRKIAALGGGVRS